MREGNSSNSWVFSFLFTDKVGWKSSTFLFKNMLREKGNTFPLHLLLSLCDFITELIVTLSFIWEEGRF